MQSEEWNPDGEQRIHRRGVPVVGALGGITPCRALNVSMERSVCFLVDVLLAEAIRHTDRTRIDVCSFAQDQH